MTPAAECIVCDRELGPHGDPTPVCESCRGDLTDRFGPAPGPGPASDTMAGAILRHLLAGLAAAVEAADPAVSEVLPIATDASRPATTRFGILDRQLGEAMQRVGRPVAVFVPNLDWKGVRGWYVIADALYDGTERFGTSIVDAEGLIDAGCTFPKNAAALYDREGRRRPDPR